jgi:protein RecA
MSVKVVEKKTTKDEVVTKEKDALDIAMETLNKRYGKGSVLSGDETVVTERVGTGSLGLDIITGGGYGVGRIVELYGPESSGKTTLCIHAMVEAQKKFPNKKVAVVDTEHCLSGDSLIYDPISGSNTSCRQLFEQDEEFTVLSLVGGNYIPQKAIIKNTGEKELYKIVSETGIELKITANHEVLTQDGFKRVDSLSLGDCIYRPKSLSNLPTEKVDFDKDLYFLLGFYLADGVNLTSVETPKIAKEDPECIKVLSAIVEKYGCNFEPKGNHIHSISTKDITNYSIDSEVLMELFVDKKLTLGEIGAKIGLNTQTIRRELIRRGIPSDYDFRAHALDLRMLRREADTDKIEGVVEVKTSKNPITRFLREFPETYLQHKVVRLPKNLTKEQLRHFLAGYISADGTVIDPDNQHRASVSVSTSSRIMAKDIEMSLLKFGIESNFSKSKKEGYDDCYVVTVNGVENCKTFLENIPIISYKKERLERAVQSVRPIERRKYEGEKRILKIKSITKLDVKETVYDISVKNSDYESQNFICEGVIVHNCFDKTYAESLGLNMDEVIISQPSSGEEALEIAELLIATGKLSICLIDSVAALIPQKEIDGEMGDSNMGLHARLMSQACRKLTGPVSKTGTVLFFTNQMRLKIGVMFGDPRTTTGGEALKFYASMRIELSKKQGEKDGDEVLTSRVTCKTVKNKLAPPFRKCEFDIRFGEGIDRLGEILDLAVACGIVKKTGSWYSYGETKLGQGSVGVKELLKDNEELAQEIEDNVMEAYNF